MRVRQLPLCVLACTVLVTATSVANAQPGETFTATATVQTAGGAAATAPVTITVARTMPQAEADKLAAAFKSGGAAGLRKALKGVAPTGSVTLGNGKPTPTGAFPVLQKAADYHSTTYDAPMPYMLRLTADGVAIHASNVRQGWATHGCVGVPLEFARKLFAEAKLGDQVSITDKAA